MNARMIMVLALGLFAAGAYASSLPTFQQLDTDGNGMLSETELEVLEQFQGEDSEFADADANNNGSVDSAEYEAWSVIELASSKTGGEAKDSKN